MGARTTRERRTGQGRERHYEEHETKASADAFRRGNLRRAGWETANNATCA